MLKIEAIPAFTDNYIWMALSANGKFALLVDPGDAAPVLQVLQTRQIKPVAILITHHHRDHTGGLHHLVTAYNMPVYTPAQESIRCCTRPVKQDDEVVVQALDACFQVLDVPGHTRGHVAYYGHGALFCGDTLFTAGCGYLFEGSPAQMHASLEKIRALADDTQIYCAHEYTADNLKFAQLVEPHNPDVLQRIEHTYQARSAGLATVPASLGLEKQTNPFLRCHVPQVVAAAETFAGRKLNSGVEIFATLRQWKDSLD